MTVTTYPDDQLLPISGLQHLAFCPRQCALIHLEKSWSESYLTALGRTMHEKVHSGEGETRGDLRMVRSMPLKSSTIGLAGVADMVEFHRDEQSTLQLPRHRGTWSIFPVEYKRGKLKKNHCDHVQLCAQAICLEEMFNTTINEGALYYGQTHSRVAVPFSKALREETLELVKQFRELIEKEITPPPSRGKHCQSCSMVEICIPELPTHARAYLAKQIKEALS